jgi:hypothetical protein
MFKLYFIYKMRNKMVHSLDPLEPHAGCGKASTFVTLVTGARYATAASCLPQMLRNVGSLCPLLLIYKQ